MNEVILLRKENNSLDSLIGKSFNQSSRNEANRILKEIHSKATQRTIGKQSLVYVTENDEIKKVGGSTLIKNKKTGEIVSNLILDQFGIWLSVMFKAFPSAGLNLIIKDNGGTPRTFGGYQASNVFNASGGANFGLKYQVGSGSTVPVRTDFVLETPFGTAPENGDFGASTDPVWNSGLGQFKTIASITAGGAGTINETTAQATWKDTSLTLRLVVLFRDIVSPAVPFIASQSIAVEYTVQL